MKKLISALVISILLIGCASSGDIALRKYSSEGYTLENRYIMHDGDTIAQMSSFEMAYDDGKIVYEATFKLRYSACGCAGDIIKTIHERKPEWDVEVELDYDLYPIFDQ